MSNSEILALEIKARIESVIGQIDDPVPLHRPSFEGKEWDYVKDCLDSGWVSSVGTYVDRFEQELAAYCGVKRAISVVNGTSALQVCLILAGVRSGDEVLVPALSFIASANAVSYLGAVPHFVDSDLNSLGIDVRALEGYLSKIAEITEDGCFNRNTGRRIAALMPMHTFGHPCDMDGLAIISEKWGIPIVEDAAEALGSKYKDNHVGCFGVAAALSFNGNKIITTGGGGAILTNDERLADKAKHLTTTAKIPHKWEFDHDQVGYNYRMPNINAALGCAQLEMMPDFLRRKRALARRYAEAFSDMEGCTFFSESSDRESNYWINALILDNHGEVELDEILNFLNKNNIMARKAWKILSNVGCYQEMPSMKNRNAKILSNSIINIPSSQCLF